MTTHVKNTSIYQNEVFIHVFEKSHKRNNGERPDASKGRLQENRRLKYAVMLGGHFWACATQFRTPSCRVPWRCLHYFSIIVLTRSINRSDFALFSSPLSNACSLVNNSAVAAPEDDGLADRAMWTAVRFPAPPLIAFTPAFLKLSRTRTKYKVIQGLGVFKLLFENLL